VLGKGLPEHVLLAGKIIYQALELPSNAVEHVEGAESTIDGKHIATPKVVLGGWPLSVPGRGRILVRRLH